MDMSMLRFAKPRPGKLEKADRRKARQSKDEAENKKVRARSGGKCEMVERKPEEDHGDHVLMEWRSYCTRRAVHIHHKIGGWGKRARGASIMAESKLHLCMECHSDIHAHVLVPDGQFFRRVK